MNQYQIALSFAGEQRPLVAAVAERLAAALGRDQVFYDRFHEAELARPDLDLYLQQLYHERSRLVVVFLGADYQRKEWCGLEWRSVRDLIKSKRSEQIMLVRVDDGALPGVFGIDGWVEARGRDPGELADLILERLRLLEPDAAPPPAAEPRATPYRCLAPRPHAYVARVEYAAIAAHILAAAADQAARSVGITTALRGAGGFGKTTLAQALCHDPRIQAAYPHGILWVTIGDRLSDGDRLSRLRDLLRRWRGSEPPTFETVTAAGGYLRDLLAGQQVLLVVDDVWSPLDLAPFRDLAPASTLLVTTRDRRNLPEGCLAERVDAMSPDEALALLGAGLPGLPATRLRGLAHRLGEWPLLLALVHRQIRERVDYEGLAPERALDEVESVLAGEGLEAFDRNDVQAHELAVGRTLNASLSMLSAEDQQRYQQLAIFPEDAEIPCPTLAGLWGLSPHQALAFCRRLDQLSLALRFDARSQLLRLHGVIRACLCGRAQDSLPAHQRRFLDSRRPTGGWPALPPAEPYLWLHLAYHLVEAGSQAELRALLLDYAWLEAKLAATDVNALLADYDALGDEQELRLVQGAVRLSAHVLADHPEELAGQLVGRLLGRTEPGIVALRERLRPVRPGAWIRPMSPSLTAAGGALVRILTGHSGPVLALAALPGGRVVSGSADGGLRVWDLATGQTVRTLAGHGGWVNAVAVLPDGRVVSGSDDRSLRVWDLTTGEGVRILEGDAGWVSAVAVLPHGRIVSGGGDGSLRVWDLATGETMRILEGHAGSVFAVAALPDGRVVSGSADCSLRVWDLATGETVRILEGNARWVSAVAVLPDGRVVFGGRYGRLRVWDLTTGEGVRILEGDAGWVSGVAVLPDGRVVSGGDDGSLRVWDLATGETVRTLEGHADWVSAVAALPDGRVVSGSYDRSLCVWDLATGESVQTLEGDKDCVRAVAALPDGRVVSGSDDGSLRVWDLATGGAVARFTVGAPVRSLAVIGARGIAAALGPAGVQLFQLEDGA